MGDNRNNITFNFLLKLDGDSHTAITIAGDAGICVVQALSGHLFNDGSSCDYDL